MPCSTRTTTVSFLTVHTETKEQPKLEASLSKFGRHTWNNKKIDSIYEANLRNKEWTYKTTKVPYDSIKVTHEGNVWTLEGTTIDDGISSETVYFDGDSIATTSNDEERLI